MRTSTTKTTACGVAVVMSLAVIGCSGQPLSTREKATGIGALAGAGTGAIFGAAVGAPAAGAALGAGGGFLVGNELQKQEASQHRTEAQINSEQQEIADQRRQIEQFKQQQGTE